MTSYAVIGASRGIGLEYVRQLATRPDSIVFAVVRNAATSTHLQAAIKGHTNVHVLEADVVDYNSLERAAKEASEVTGGKLDYLIHNAAGAGDPVLRRVSFGEFPNMEELDEDLITTFQINTLGVIHSITAFLPLLRAGSAKKIVVISTGGAHVQTVYKQGAANMAAYHISKCAAYMATTKWAINLQDEGFVVVSLTPGLVDTSATQHGVGDLQAAHARLVAVEEEFAKKGIPVVLEMPEESVSKQLKIIDGLKPSDNGLLLNHYTGKEYSL
ncbi:NAD-P-binding protein [Lentinus tigrinus ALCF2SS1-7]|uniref:NAD-P-binding protein n=1 Tax=Lentinus tigrinus ALCF2SS1-6 TaxID=1328759 RepID=A0A5C2S672_9APHY|nr:NAD-P-binding protein [Lentinus tigrinus ALCF2SS1-6]RPD72783.1 NAD-P-binding protein [Lentinus tigrinus ALCF2SS1-7]